MTAELKNSGTRESRLGMINADKIVIRRLPGIEECKPCVELQREVWGRDFADVVPANVMMACQRVGGLTAGAFDPAGRLLAFVVSLAGFRGHRLAHWSNMMVVKAGCQNLGIGQRLKMFQRQYCLDHGVETLYWSVDPLIARNAHLNFNRLGVDVDEYVFDLYGTETHSELHSGLGTDRFIMAWHIDSPRVKEIVETGRAPYADAQHAGARVVNAAVENAGGQLRPAVDELPLLPVVRVEIPNDILAVKKADLAVGQAWRETTRTVLTHYLDAGYRVTTFYRDTESGRCYYCLDSL